MSEPLSIDAYLDSRIATPDSQTPAPEGGGASIELTPSGAPVNPPVVEVTPEPVVPAAEPAVEPVLPVEPAEPALSAEEAATAGEFAQGRFRIKDPQDKALIMYARANGMTIAEAAQAMNPAAAPAAAVEPPTPEPTTSDAIAAKEARLADLRASINAEIDAAGESGVTVTREFRAMQQEEMDLTRELPLLQVDHKMAVAASRRAEQREYDTQFTQWEEAAEQDFPALAEPAHPYFAAVAAESTRLAASTDDRDKAFLQQPDCAYLLAARVAKQTGYKPAVGVAAAVPVPVAPTPAAPAAAPAPSALPRAIGAAPGSSASEAHRVTVASPTPSPLEGYRQAVAANRDAPGIMAGLDQMMKGFKAGAAA